MAGGADRGVRALPHALLPLKLVANLGHYLPGTDLDLELLDAVVDAATVAGTGNVWQPLGVSSMRERMPRPSRQAWIEALQDIGRQNLELAAGLGRLVVGLDDPPPGEEMHDWHSGNAGIAGSESGGGGASGGAVPGSDTAQLPAAGFDAWGYGALRCASRAVDPGSMDWVLDAPAAVPAEVPTVVPAEEPTVVPADLVLADAAQPPAAAELMMAGALPVPEVPAERPDEGGWEPGGLADLLDEDFDWGPESPGGGRSADGGSADLVADAAQLPAPADLMIPEAALEVSDVPAEPIDDELIDWERGGSVGGGLEEAATPRVMGRDGGWVERLDLLGGGLDVSAVVGSEAAVRVELVLAGFARRVAELIVGLAGESDPNEILANHARWVKELAAALGAGVVGVAWDPHPSRGGGRVLCRRSPAQGAVGADGGEVGRILVDPGGVADQRRLSRTLVHEVWHAVQLAALGDAEGVAARLLAAAGQWRESLTGTGWKSAVRLGAEDGSEAERRAAFERLSTVAHERHAETMAMRFGQLLDQALAGAWTRVPGEGRVAEGGAPEGSRSGPVDPVGPVDRFDLVDPADLGGRLGVVRAWHVRLDEPMRQGLADIRAAGDGARAAWRAVGESVEAVAGLAEGGLGPAGVEAVRAGLAGVMDRYREVFDLLVGLRFGLGWLPTPGEFMGGPRVGVSEEVSEALGRSAPPLGGVAGRVLTWRFRVALS